MLWSNRFKRLTEWFFHPTLTWVLPVKGVYFYDTEAVENHGLLFSGAELTLRHEPDNEYDANAVQIWLNSQPPCLLGYIPRTHSRRIARYLSQADHCHAHIETAYREYHRLHLDAHIQLRLHWWARLSAAWR
ncbi:MAG: HIRAN domain-containing protein [Hydrogenovibrio sp.]